MNSRLAITYRPSTHHFRVERLQDGAARGRVASDIGWLKRTDDGWHLVGAANSERLALARIAEMLRSRAAYAARNGRPFPPVAVVEISLWISRSSRKRRGTR